MERQPLRRRRPALSCLACRRRKVKCDRKDPCGQCVSSKIKCNYSSGAQVQATTVEQDDTPPTTLGNSQNHQSNSSPEIQQDPLIPSDLQHSFQRIQMADGSSNPIHGLTETNRDLLAQAAGLQESKIIMKKTRISQWTDMMGTSKELSPIIACYAKACGHGNDNLFASPETKQLVDEMAVLLQECKSIASRIKGARPSLFYPDFGLLLPSREVADRMASLYLESFESMYRILHVPTFWDEYRRFWADPESATAGLRLKVLLVMAIGSSLLHYGECDPRFPDMARQWIYSSQAWLSEPLQKSRLSITGVQIHCLNILARQVLSVGADLAWMSMGSLTHRAMQIGLHRDPKHLPQMTLLQAEIRRRLWSTIVEMILQSSLDSAMPPRISMDEFDTETPSNVNDDEMEELSTELNVHPKNTFTDTSMQLILIESLPTRLRILQLLNSFRSELSYLDVLSLSADITQAYRKASSFMVGKEQLGVTPFHRNLMHYLVRRFMIPLHFPFASKARANPLFHYSLKESIDAAMAIVSPELDERFSRLMSLGGGIFREGFRLAFGAISIELIAQAESQRQDGTLHHHSQYRELLKKSLGDMTSLSLERVQQGETNIKTHMFICMILAQVEAIEAGVSPEFGIAQSARDSLQVCRDILKTNNSSSAFPEFSNKQGDCGLDLDMDTDFFFPDSGFL